MSKSVTKNLNLLKKRKKKQNNMLDGLTLVQLSMLISKRKTRGEKLQDLLMSKS